jgi:hypothetical protein
MVVRGDLGTQTTISEKQDFSVMQTAKQTCYCLLPAV